jgi:hypothetical protein
MDLGDLRGDVAQIYNKKPMVCYPGYGPSGFDIHRMATYIDTSSTEFDSSVWDVAREDEDYYNVG